MEMRTGSGSTWGKRCEAGAGCVGQSPAAHCFSFPHPLLPVTPLQQALQTLSSKAQKIGGYKCPCLSTIVRAHPQQLPVTVTQS